MTAKRHGIAIFWTQYDTASLDQPHRWVGRPGPKLEDVYDRQHAGAPAEGFYCTIFEWVRIRRGPNLDKISYHYELVTDGGHMGGRRHHGFSTLEQAKKAGETWAKRRFYTIEE